jgi:hypothetical protein
VLVLLAMRSTPQLVVAPPDLLELWMITKEELQSMAIEDERPKHQSHWESTGRQPWQCSSELLLRIGGASSKRPWWSCRMDLHGPTTSVGTRTDYSVGPWDYLTCAARYLMT